MPEAKEMGIIGVAISAPIWIYIIYKILTGLVEARP